jgi:hypothetical protein
MTQRPNLPHMGPHLPGENVGSLKRLEILLMFKSVTSGLESKQISYNLMIGIC